MGRTAAQQAGIRQLLKEMLKDPAVASDLRARAQEAVPGAACSSRGSREAGLVTVTTDQRRWMEQKVATKHWSKLSKEEKKAFCEQAEVHADDATVPAGSAGKKRGADAEEAPAPAEPKKQKPAYQPLANVVAKTRARRVTALAEELLKHASANDAAETLAAAVKAVGATWPDFGAEAQQQIFRANGSQECANCSALLRGICGTPCFSSPNPPDGVRSAQDHIDRVVRGIFPSLQAVQKQGYNIGRIRWDASGRDRMPERAPRGRKSKQDDEVQIARVRAALEEHSQGSSRLCFNRQAGEWMLVNTLTADKTHIFNQQDAVSANMSLSTMSRIMRKHLANYKPAWVESDWCIYCHDLDRKVMPQVKEAVAQHRQVLTGYMEHYFEAFDNYVTSASLSEKPGLHLRELQHYIWHHCERDPCRKHQGGDFPCGQGRLRARGSGFPQRRRTDLHGAEAEACNHLRGLSKLLDSYLFHRSANEHQKPVLTQLQTKPEAGHVTLLSDWKELVTLPIRARQTGEEFYAQARKEISVFGCVLSERKAPSSAEVVTTRILILSDILDHTSARACQCIALALRQRRGTEQVKTYHLVSDAGPHFRAYENLWFNCVVLPQKLKAQVITHFGVEKHMKSEADRLFGMLEQYLAKARTRRIDIIEMEDLQKVVESMHAEQKARDPTTSPLVVLLDQTSKKIPAEQRFKLMAEGFRISKTYCVSSTPWPANKRFGVKVCNHTFSSMVASTDITSQASLVPAEDKHLEYRRGFWSDGRKGWDTAPEALGRHAETALTRRQKVQEHLLPAGANQVYSETVTQSQFEALVQKRQLQLTQRKQRRDQRRNPDNAAPASSEESSSSSSSSSSDTSRG